VFPGCQQSPGRLKSCPWRFVSTFFFFHLGTVTLVAACPSVRMITRTIVFPTSPLLSCTILLLCPVFFYFLLPPTSTTTLFSEKCSPRLALLLFRRKYLFPFMDGSWSPWVLAPFSWPKTYLVSVPFISFPCF